MKIHTSDFKNQIGKLGRQLDSIITYYLDGEKVELDGSVLNSIVPSFQGDILKSTMKQLEIDSNIDIPLDTIINYKFGVLVNGEYEYIDFGDYIIYSSEKQEDTYSYKITCYDFMLRSMVPYDKSYVSEFPMTVRSYITNLCNELSLEFQNENDEFANYDRILPSDVYQDLGYTFRDIFDELAQVTASSICINKDNKVEIRYINETNDEIDEEYLRDVNVNFGQKYGPINSVVLSRSAGADNIYYQDEESIEENGLCELKIEDNQIMNGNDREDYIEDIFDKVNGLEYYINDYTSTGITYYDLCDRYKVKIGDNEYSCVMFNDEVQVTQGLVEMVHTDLPETSETDYTKADKTDRKINQTNLIVDKQNQRINSMVSQLDSDGTRLNTIETNLTSQQATLNVITTNIDEDGNVTSVKTTEGFTFDNRGLNISNSDSNFNTQITNESTQYKNGDEIITGTSKDGFMTTDLKEKGVHSYSYDGSQYDFVAERVQIESEYAYAHFYNGSDL